MATPDDKRDTNAVAQAVVDEEHKGFPVVWLLPLVAVLVGGWLIWKTVSETGPSITISFETAEGIQADKTRIKYRDVEVGKVNSVEFSDDISHILLKVSMNPGTENFLTDRTRFWVVKPRIGVGGVSGLSTLVSGAYIAMEPSREGVPTKQFTGLEKPPVITADVEGTSYQLRAKKLGSVSIGAPVYFRQFDVGEITEYRLSDDHSHVDIGFFVRAPHDQYIRESTRFWNAGGVNLTLSATGMQLEMESIVSLLTGGIAFETRDILEDPITIAHTFITRYSGSVRGLAPGAPVEFRGIRLGTVKSIEIGYDPEHEGVTIPIVLIDLEPERLQNFALVDKAASAVEIQEETLRETVKRVAYAVREKGMRARLQTGNLITGALYVDLEFFPDADPASLVMDGEYPEIPTLPNPLEGILIGFNKIIDKLEAARLEDTLSNLNELMASTNELVGTNRQ
jgi:paraquat-inducible protein B